MSNVIVIGDCHLKCNAPVSRKDNYPVTILNKLLYIASVAKTYSCNKFILLGDVFDSPITSLPYLATVINTFKKIHELGITVYTIVGNHDIKNNRIDSLDSTALGILISTGYVTLAPSELIVDDTVFRCFNYTDKLTGKQSDDKFEVCVAHLYYEFGLSDDSLHADDVSRLNYNAMILGHYHVPCDDLKVGRTMLYRPGSLSRSTSEPYNKIRIPRVLIFNCTKHKAVYLEVSCEAGCDVFVENIESNNKASVSMKDLIDFITTSYNTSDMNVRDYFVNLQMPDECRSKISHYLDVIGA